MSEENAAALDADQDEVAGGIIALDYFMSHALQGPLQGAGSEDGGGFRHKKTTRPGLVRPLESVFWFASFLRSLAGPR